MPVAVIAGAWCAFGTGSHLFGVAGWRSGPLLVAGILVGAFPIALWLLIRPERNSVLWALVLAVLGLVATGAMADRAPASAGVLRSNLDQLSLPFFEKKSDREVGGGSCRPECPGVVRTYAPPDMSPEAVFQIMRVAVTSAGFTEISRAKVRDELRATKGDLLLQANVSRRASEPVVEVRLSTRR